MSTTRRTILQGLAATPFAASAVLAPLARAQAEQSDIARLWHAYLVALGASTVAHQAYFDAEAKLPWWAAPYGPKYIDHEGNPCGENSCWPAIQGASPSSGPGMYRMIRLGPDEIRKGFSWHHSQTPLDVRLAEHEARMTARAAERAALRLPELSAAADALSDIVFDHQQAIEKLPPSTVNALAAKAIINALLGRGSDETVETSDCLDLLALVLRGFLPHLTGELAEDAAEIVNNPTRRIDQMRAWRGIMVSA